MSGNAPKPALEIDGLRYSWPGQHVLLSMETLTIAQGSKVLVQGPSGSGKTTFLSLVTGVLTPSAGSVCVLGHDLKMLTPSQRDALRRDTMGVIFQMFNLLPFLTVLENVLLPLQLSQKRRQSLAQGSTPTQEAHRLLDALGLSSAVMARSTHQLSIGQQQRVAAARALIGNPSLIIADEPTSALDEGNQNEFLTLLIEQVHQTNATLIMVSHDSRIAERFDQVMTL